MSLVNTKTHFEPLPRGKFRLKIILSSSHDARALFLSEDLRLGGTCRSSEKPVLILPLCTFREKIKTRTFPVLSFQFFPSTFPPSFILTLNLEIKTNQLHVVLFCFILLSKPLPIYHAFFQSARAEREYQPGYSLVLFQYSKQTAQNVFALVPFVKIRIEQSSFLALQLGALFTYFILIPTFRIHI